jgi:7-cyano-7-deazaguanine synthase
MSKAYVLLSGGIDSSTCLGLAIENHQESVVGVSFNYGQRHTKEIEHAKMVCDSYGVEHKILNARGLIAKGGLTDEDLEMPNVSYDDLPQGVSPTYVPFRNGTMLSLLTSYASTDDEAEAIYFGAHADDAANWAYPDCTPEFIGGMANAIYIGTYHKIRLYTPLIFMQKPDIVSLGEEVRVPWELTWSCYEGGEIHCGVCPTCRSRRDGFALAGVQDPTEYAEDLQ